MTILVPTDFSKLSKVAVLYAVRIAKKLKGDIILLSVINAKTTDETLATWRKLEGEMLLSVKQDAEQLMREITEEVNGEIKISYQHIMGFPVEEMIESFAIENRVDLIVMGTKGATGLKKVVMGSNATAVIDSSSKPVIAVPGETTFTQIQKIVYATDLENIDEEIKTVTKFAALFNASVKVLHVIPKDSAQKLDTTMITSTLIKVSGYPEVSFHVSQNDQIGDEVEKFVAENQADLLAMFTHKLDFYEKLFGKSVTRHLAFHPHVPLLAFNKTNLL